MGKLKPCPFCGGEAVMYTVDPHEHKVGTATMVYEGNTFIECTECSCTIGEPTRKDAIALWNRRVEE